MDGLSITGPRVYVRIEWLYEKFKDSMINMFGNLEIHTSRGVLRESELNSHLIYRMIAYFLLSRKKVVTAFAVATFFVAGYG